MPETPPPLSKFTKRFLYGEVSRTVHRLDDGPTEFPAMHPRSWTYGAIYLFHAHS